MTDTQSLFSAALEGHRSLFEVLPRFATPIQTMVERCQQALQNQGKVVFFGNGGSAADAQHLAAEFVVRYKRERRNSAVKIGTIRLTSPFTTSQFGDNGVFFKHQRYEDR